MKYAPTPMAILSATKTAQAASLSTLTPMKTTTTTNVLAIPTPVMPLKTVRIIQVATTVSAQTKKTGKVASAKTLTNALLMLKTVMVSQETATISHRTLNAFVKPASYLSSITKTAFVQMASLR